MSQKLILIGGVVISVLLVLIFLLSNHRTIKNTEILTHNVSHSEHNPLTHKHNMTVSSEREFIEKMIPHHEEAIATAYEVLTRGGSTEEIRNLADSIISAQDAEVTMLKEWYQSWYQEVYSSSDTHTTMMRDLTPLSGSALDRVFLEDMIIHHQGALEMADSVAPYIEHEELRELAKNIMVTQATEIELMLQLLASMTE